MFQLNFLRTSSVSDIINKIRPYEYVSFDIFDTLLKRDVVRPTDIFDIVGTKHQDPDFKNKRIQAEGDLRKNSGKEEITLQDIYDALGQEYASYKDDELRAEEEALQLNRPLYEVYQYCKDNHKKVLIVSDMYLPADFLQAILKKYKIEYDACFISSDYDVQKVTGNLFKVALQQCQLRPSQVIHIGDSVRGDFLGARKAGVASVLLPKIINQTKWIDLHDPVNHKCFDVFVNNHLNTEENNYYQFGYAYFGPVLYGFIQWLHDAVQNRKIFFFARDGYLVKKVYNQLFPESQDDYIYLSRRALSVPLLWKHAEWGECFQYMTMTRFFTIRTFLDRLGLNPDEFDSQVRNSGLEMDMAVAEKNLKQNSRVHNLYEQIKNVVIANSQTEFQCLKEYLKEKNFAGDIAVVDIGWNGSMQRYLVELCQAMEIPVQMEGFYFGMRKDIPNTVSHGYFYQPGNMELEPKISFMQGLFESFFLSHEGSTKRYRLHQDHAEPELYSPEYHQQDSELKAFEEVQQGAEAFCLEYAKSLTAHHHFKANEYAANLIRFGSKPSISEVSLFGDFRFFDTNCVFLAKPAGMVYYFKHPRDLLRDFSYSVWKAGFMRRLFQATLPYYKIYSMLKRAR